ncbi:hypothetical protein [Terrisporobacter petrolearius]
MSPFSSSTSTRYSPLCSLFRYFRPFIITSTSLDPNI